MNEPAGEQKWGNFMFQMILIAPTFSSPEHNARVFYYLFRCAPHHPAVVSSTNVTLLVCSSSK
jgi:hypothetical protein